MNAIKQLIMFHDSHCEEKEDCTLSQEAAAELAAMEKVIEVARETYEYMKARVASDDGARMRDKLEAALRGLE